jgi:hypothetical protein
MGLTRKKYVLDKKFQFSISIKAIILPLLTTLTISAVLLYFADKNNDLITINNKHINNIIENQVKMIDIFLETPVLQNSKNPQIKNSEVTFKQNINQLRKISVNSVAVTKNAVMVFNFLLIMTFLQTIIIFGMFIFYTHKVSGPIHVMTNQLRKIRSGKDPDYRALRKNDHLKDFYNELWATFDYLNIKPAVKKPIKKKSVK